MLALGARLDDPLDEIVIKLPDGREIVVALVNIHSKNYGVIGFDAPKDIKIVRKRLLQKKGNEQ